MANYLYGARYAFGTGNTYVDEFDKNYKDVGKNVLSYIQGSSEKVFQGSLRELMDKGIDKAQDLAEKQAGQYKMTPKEFCKNFNELLENFEILAYRSLEYTSTDISYRIIKDMDAKLKSQEELSEKIKSEKKIMKKLEDAINGSTQDMWNSITGLMKGKEFKDLLQPLVDARIEDFVSRNAKYGAMYAGLLGETSSYLLIKAMKEGKSEILNSLQEQMMNGNVNVKMIGKDLVGKRMGKGDLLLGELIFSIKNYTDLRNRFEGFTSQGENRKKKYSIDMSLHNSGTLKTVVENFAKDTEMKIFGDKEEFLVYLMNALYFGQYGFENYYLEATQILDILTNAYAYVFLAQGATEKLGYSLLEESTNKTMPGYMWLVGKGVVPVFEVLTAIKNNFDTIRNIQRNVPKSGIYTHLKISGATQGVLAVDKLTNTRGPLYGEDQPSIYGRYYRRSFNTKGHLDDVNKILLGRYSTFSENINASIKLHLQFTALNAIINEING